MYDIIGRVKENVLLDAGTSKQDLASEFCHFFVDKITNIRDRLRDNNRFAIEKEREPGMLEFQSGIRVLCAKDNRVKQGHKLWNRPNPIELNKDI